MKKKAKFPFVQGQIKPQLQISIALETLGENKSNVVLCNFRQRGRDILKNGSLADPQWFSGSKTVITVHKQA